LSDVWNATQSALQSTELRDRMFANVAANADTNNKPGRTDARLGEQASGVENARCPNALRARAAHIRIHAA
jgi:hypothetical protein